MQNASEHGIVLLMTVIPAIFAALAVPIMYFYPLGDKQLQKMQAEMYSDQVAIKTTT